MSRINTNVSSLIAQNQLRRTNSDLQTSLTRLSTGLRINTGKDDPAGLIASESLRSDITSINKALSNTQRANQIISTADSALGQVSSLLNDIRGLVVEAANSGALSDDEIAANQLQVDSSLEAINRISQTTTFQGRKLLDGSLEFQTTTGTNFSSLTNLQINQANLGTTGSVSLSIEITSAATRAQLDITNIPAAGDAGEGTITLENRTANAQAATAAQTTLGGGAYTISANDGGAFDGEAGNDVTVSIVSGPTSALTQATSGVKVVNTTGDFSISAKSGGLFEGEAGDAVTVTVEAGNTATAQAESAGQTINGVADAFTVSAKADGIADGEAGNAYTVALVSGATAGVAVAGNVVTITVDNDRSYSLSEIKTIVDADVDFNVDFEFNIAAGNENVLFQGDGSDDIASFDLDGATSGADADAIVDLTGNVLTITTNEFQNTLLSDIKTAVEADANFSDNFDFNLGVDVGFRAAGTDDFTAAALSGGSNVAAEASLVGNALTITVDDALDRTLAHIATALASDADFDDFTFAVGTGGIFESDGTDDNSDVAFTGGTDTTVEDIITITSPSGLAYNGTITIDSSTDTDGEVTAELDDNNNITILVDNTDDTTLDDIVDAINGLTGYSAEITTSAGDETFSPGTDSFTTDDIAGATDGGTTDAAVFEIGGLKGSQVFNVAAGTTIDQLVAQINLVTDATGIDATANGTTLEINSTAYGTDAFVDFRVIDEDDAGTFTTAVGKVAREEGTDISAKINGVDASSSGNIFKVKTATLDISLTVEDGFSGDIDFEITGGGALFQLGPEVVTNQQARIGIGSVNTARLGGSSGKLYQLSEGGTASLSNDATTASEIVDDAITQVTQLRGRLGAFQRTALESNLASLNDTLSNLYEAESSIRDTDFAQESARLTRAQILVQSGTAVLGIANQNPQNVLSLLR